MIVTGRARIASITLAGSPLMQLLSAAQQAVIADWIEFVAATYPEADVLVEEGCVELRAYARVMLCN
jgi:hypothetical protein